MRDRIITVVLALGLVAAAIAVAATDGGETRKFGKGLDPWESPDGMNDESKLPATMGVSDSTGAVVGYIKRSDEALEMYPLPVYGEDGRQIGQVGENGYWPLGEAEPFIPDAYTVIEEYGSGGELTRCEIIRPVQPIPGENGRVGSTHETCM